MCNLTIVGVIEAICLRLTLSRAVRDREVVVAWNWIAFVLYSGHDAVAHSGRFELLTPCTTLRKWLTHFVLLTPILLNIF